MRLLPLDRTLRVDSKTHVVFYNWLKNMEVISSQSESWKSLSAVQWTFWLFSSIKCHLGTSRRSHWVSKRSHCINELASDGKHHRGSKANRSVGKPWPSDMPEEKATCMRIMICIHKRYSWTKWGSFWLLGRRSVWLQNRKNNKLD